MNKTTILKLAVPLVVVDPVLAGPLWAAGNTRTSGTETTTPSPGAIEMNCITTNTNRIRPKAQVQHKPTTRSQIMKTAQLWIKDARLTSAKPMLGSRMTLIVDMGYTGATPSRPFSLILEETGKRRTQIATYLWKQGLAPGRRASHRFSLLAPIRCWR